MEEAKLFTLPKKLPLIVGYAITEKTARWTGSWADAFITVSHPVEKLKIIIDAFYEGGGEGKPMFLKMQISYDSSEKKALQGAFSQWKTNIFQSNMLTELRTPKQFQQAAEFLNPEIMKEHVKISDNTMKHAEWINEYAELGFDEIVVHNVNTNQEQFIEDFGSKVLPQL